MQLSVKYRPQKFSEVVGQDVSVRILINSILMSRTPHAIYMSGQRGVGKTTLARLYAAALNCESFNGDVCGVCSSCKDVENTSHIDVLELDAASNNGVDDIRELENKINRVITGRYRVVVLDECHMLSKQAQAAFLKTLEEPPDRVVFILVTTEPEKLQDTVRSRCLSLPLRPLHPRDVAQGIWRVLQAEGKPTETLFVDSLSLYGGGSMRDVLQILDQVFLSAGDGPLDISLLEQTTEVVSTRQYQDLASVMICADVRYALEEVNRWYGEGIDLGHLFRVGVPNLLRDFMICLSGCYSNEIYYLSGIDHEALQRNLSLSLEDVRNINAEWYRTVQIMKGSTHEKIIFEMFMANVAGICCKPDGGI